MANTTGIINPALSGIGSGQRGLEAARRQGRLAQGLSAVKKMSAKDDKKLRNVCQEMESLFVKQLLTTMRKTIKKSGFLDGGRAEEIFTDMLDDKYAMRMSKSQSFGLAQMLYGQLSAGKKW